MYFQKNLFFRIVITWDCLRLVGNWLIKFTTWVSMHEQEINVVHMIKLVSERLKKTFLENTGSQNVFKSPLLVGH